VDIELEGANGGKDYPAAFASEPPSYYVIHVMPSDRYQYLPRYTVSRVSRGRLNV